ncbi:MAG TPA: di-heme oxidoredictase family protein [Hyphomicrobiaceae bacterium]|nr:di-heme oxidoredictase family protein [Hyphomicrobiaceae bacterium]
MVRGRPILTILGSAKASGLLAGLLVLGTGAALSLAADQRLSSTLVSGAALHVPGEDQPGGEATSRGSTDTAGAFSQPSGNMGFAKELDFKIGNGLFRKLWVSAPSSTKSSDGLGPLYNARGCQSCHLKDGRGHPPRGSRVEERSVSMFLRLSIPPETDEDARALAEGRQAVVPEPTYGSQLQEFAVQGHPGEGRMVVNYEEIPVILAGGEVVRLRRPTYGIVDLGYGPLHPRTMMSPRMAPQMIGLGLLEAIPEADILNRADPEDRDGDGISGRANRVWSVERNGPTLGRFGWKAGQPTVLQQTAEAFAGDIGIGSWVVPHPYGDCTPVQRQCRGAPHGGTREAPGEEINRKLLNLVAFYARNLAVPARRNPAAADVLAGKHLFSAIGCASCHTPSHTTGENSPDPHLRGQAIWPYTDLLLHDLGDDLADGRPEGLADGREWRTAPLWGIGLTETVNGHTFFLHDGRARNITEAILWHGGEAQRARDQFARLSPDDRRRLLAFVNSL